MMAAVPDGTARQIYGKYVVVFMTYALFYVSGVFTDSFFCWIVFRVTGETTLHMNSLLLLMLFVQMFLRSVDVPFLVRFGSKYGKYVLILSYILILFAVLLTSMYVPAFENMIEGIRDWCIRLMNGELEEEAQFIVSAFPVAAIAAYLISYRVSCRLWLKGVANYE